MKVIDNLKRMDREAVVKGAMNIACAATNPIATLAEKSWDRWQSGNYLAGSEKLTKAISAITWALAAPGMMLVMFLDLAECDICQAQNVR